MKRNKRCCAIIGIFIVVFNVIGLSQNSANKSAVPIYKNASAGAEERIDDLMSRMSINDKALILHPNFFSTKENEKLGIPRIKFIDGSYGLRCNQSTAFSTPVNYAATFNSKLVKRVGVALAKEAKAKGRNMVLGPVVLMHRNRRPAGMQKATVKILTSQERWLPHTLKVYKVKKYLPRQILLAPKQQNITAIFMMSG